MGYTLQAIVGNAEILSPVTGDLPTVRLPQNQILIPLTTDVRSVAGQIPFLPFTDEGYDVVPDSLAALCKSLSRLGRIVYLEAEFHGGTGIQAMLIAEHGNLVRGPVVDDEAISAALRSIGVVTNGARDEFEAIHLGGHRDTDDWLQT